MLFRNSALMTRRVIILKYAQLYGDRFEAFFKTLARIKEYKYEKVVHTIYESGLWSSESEINKKEK